jgi:membrane protease YdiL (CAAX protease family)
MVELPGMQGHKATWKGPIDVYWLAGRLSPGHRDSHANDGSPSGMKRECIDTMEDELRPPDKDFRPPRYFPLVVAVFEGGIAVVAVGLGWLLAKDPLASLPRTLPDTARGAAWGTAAAAPPLLLLWLLLKCPLRPFANLVRIVDELLVPLFRNCGLVELAVISALAGLGEEMLFRGVVQQAAADWAGGPSGMWVGLAVAAGLFGLLHHVTRTYALLASLIGLYLGGIWLATGNLLVPILAHALYDFLALMYFVNVRGPLARLR